MYILRLLINSSFKLQNLIVIFLKKFHFISDCLVSVYFDSIFVVAFEHVFKLKLSQGSFPYVYVICILKEFARGVYFKKQRQINQIYMTIKIKSLLANFLLIQLKYS